MDVPNPRAANLLLPPPPLLPAAAGALLVLLLVPQQQGQPPTCVPAAAGVGRVAPWGRPAAGVTAPAGAGVLQVLLN